jgi:membrane-bound lytic murein transglycosylase D
LATLALLASSCQTAQKPVTLLPAKTAPPLTAKATPSSTAPQSAQPAPPPADAAKPQVEAQSPAQAQPEPLPLAPSSDPVGDLIARVEKDYQAGLTAYHANQIETAKQAFDRAFNTLLESNHDVRSDGRLEKEFNRMVEGVNHLNLGDTATDSEAQKSEPAPIDETSGITPSADPNVKVKAQAEIKSTHSDLPLMMTDQVAGYISYFSNRGRGTFERAFARSGRYHDMMVSILKEEGVPQDLIYLAQAESGFHPLAVSRAGARGIWQFMGSRARGYGLDRTEWVDDRQDPEKSTRAAARHLRDLYAQFGDWYLAMAAYNSGPGTVQAAVKRTGYADFWELYRRNALPQETRNYVPIILAVTLMAKNLSNYGFDDVSMDDPVHHDSVTIDYPVDLRLVAECVDATTAQLQDLNPSLLRLSTPREGKFQLHLPPGTRDQYQTTIASIPADLRLWWRYHKIQAGETLASLGRSYRVTPTSIVAANSFAGSALQDINLQSASLPTMQLEAGGRLIIPVPANHALSDTTTYAHRITRYNVRKGDTVQTVAENFGVSAQMLRRWNGLRGDSLRGRKMLALHLPVTPGSEIASTAAKPRTSAPSRKTTPSARAAAERSASAKPAPPKPAKKSEEAEPGKTAALHHTVKSGETLYSIATTYKTTVDALKRNNRNVAVLRPGMILIVQR